MLAEEFVPTSESALVDRKPFQTYSYGANRRNQPKTTDLIPKRLPALATFFLFVLSLVAGLNLLAAKADSLRAIVGPEAADSFTISGSGTLTNWFCSLSLFLCGALCLQLFCLRKHKRDDYGGMYRVWIVMAGMFFLASVDCAIDLRSIGAKLFELLTHRSLLQTPWLMMTIELIVLAVIVIRMLFEVRASRFTLAAVLLVWLGFVGCVVLNRADVSNRLDWLEPRVAYGNCMLLGCIGSLVALTFYARFVFLHAHGLIERKAASRIKRSWIKRKTATRSPRDKAQEKPETKTERPVLQVAATPEPEQQPATKSKTRKKPVAKQNPALSEPVKSADQPVATAKPARRSAGPLAGKIAKAKSKKNPVVDQTSPPAESPAAAEGLQQQLDDIDAGSVSKAERRRLRKLAKRAAREKKAA